MVSRRTFLSLAAATITAPRVVSAQQPAQKVALYANVGPDLIHYDVDVAGAELTKRETVTLTGGIQYAWPHKSRRYLYVASSNAAPNYVREPQTDHFVTALAIDPKTGALSKHGEPIKLPQRGRSISARTYPPTISSSRFPTRAPYGSTASTKTQPWATK